MSPIPLTLLRCYIVTLLRLGFHITPPRFAPPYGLRGPYGDTIILKKSEIKREALAPTYPPFTLGRSRKQLEEVKNSYRRG